MLFCLACECDADGSTSSLCDSIGICTCETGYTGGKCDSCDAGYTGDKCGGCDAAYYKSGSNCIGKTFVSWIIHIPNLAWNI